MAQPPFVNDRYELVSPIGSGGMGTVWRGFDTVLDRPIAVKFIHADLLGDNDPRSQARRRFRREARILARLEHRGLPAVYDFGNLADGTVYLVMRHVPGNTLADLHAEHAPLPTGWVAWLGFQLLTVLGVVHRAGLVHRDVKPANLILTPLGELVLCDFGIATSVHSGIHSRITMVGERLGTPGYQAPEVIAGETVTAAGDLWSAGTVLTELMGSGGSVESGIGRILIALTEPEPINRPTSATEVAEEFLHQLSEEELNSGLTSLPGFATGQISWLAQWSSAVPMTIGEFPPAPKEASITRLEVAELRRSTELLLAEDRPSQAIATLRHALKTLADADEFPEALALRRDLARCYEMAGYPEQARRVYEDLAGDAERLLGADHPLVSTSAEQATRLTPD